MDKTVDEIGLPFKDGWEAYLRTGAMSSPALPVAWLPFGTVPQKMAFTKAEAAEVVGMKIRFIEREIAAGRLPAKKAGNKVLIGRDALAQWFSALPDAAYSTNRRAPDEGTQKTREIARDVVGGVPRKRGRKPKDQGAA